MPADLGVVWAVMKWPLAACLILPPLLVYLGLHVVRREVIFVDLALAQVATLGTCVALIAGYHFEDRITFFVSLAVTFVAASIAVIAALQASLALGLLAGFVLAGLQLAPLIDGHALAASPQRPRSALGWVAPAVSIACGVAPALVLRMLRL